MTHPDVWVTTGRAGAEGLRHVDWDQAVLALAVDLCGVGHPCDDHRAEAIDLLNVALGVTDDR
jgi:hypothetical protein